MSNLNYNTCTYSSSSSLAVRFDDYPNEIPNTTTASAFENRASAPTSIKVSKVKRVKCSTQPTPSAPMYYADLLIEKGAANYDLSQEYQQTKIIPYQLQTPWLPSALRVVAELKELPENWDSYGSSRITERSYQALQDVLFQIQDERLPEPFICPVPGGGLQIEWEIGKYELELEFLPDGSVEFLTVDKTANHLEDGMVEGKIDNENNMVEIQKVVAWLLSR